MIFLINNCSYNKMVYENIYQLLRSIKLKEFLGKSIDDVFFIKYQRMGQENYIKLLNYKYTDKRIYFINQYGTNNNTHIHCLCNIVIDRLGVKILKSRYDIGETEIIKEIILKDLEKYEKEYN